MSWIIILFKIKSININTKNICFLSYNSDDVMEMILKWEAYINMIIKLCLWSIKIKLSNEIDEYLVTWELSFSLKYLELCISGWTEKPSHFSLFVMFVNNTTL